MAPLFHLSIPVNDLDRAKDFYLSTLGCEIGRETKGRFDINFFGHHVVAHLSPKDAGMDGGTILSPDGSTSPLRHFGVVQRLREWDRMKTRLEAADVEWVLTPRISYSEGKPRNNALCNAATAPGMSLSLRGSRMSVFATDAPA